MTTQGQGDLFTDLTYSDTLSLGNTGLIKGKFHMEPLCDAENADLFK